jgi:transcriptional regulator with AbiEi antitoxin domain of type IV toxin-antitoxin system
MSRKINQLLNNWPRGTVYASSWLRQKGIGSDLVQNYKRRNWVYALGDNAVARVGDKVTWEGGVYALQKQLGLKVHVGGKTALEMSGYAHFLPLGKPPVYLFGEPGTRLPQWFRKYDWGHPVHLVATALFPEKDQPGLTEKSQGEFSLTVASPERAIMEALSLVPQNQSFEESGLLMEGMTTFRPKLVQTLLMSCRSIKVKRLFMYLAEKLNHSWVKRLDLSKVDFGKGKRMIESGGSFDPKYQISVPLLNDERQRTVEA